MLGNIRLCLFIYAFLISTSVFPQNIGLDRNSSGLSHSASDLISEIIISEQSLLEKFHSAFNRDQHDSADRVANDPSLTCATSLVHFFNKEKENISSVVKEKINSLLNTNNNNSITSEVYYSPSGLFELIYETSGMHSVPIEDYDKTGVPDYVEQIAEYCDYSWKLLIDSLKYLPPQLENGTYPIEFQKMYARGYTIRNADNNEFTKIVLNSDFKEFGLNSNDDMGIAKTTVVHELKHAVQYEYTKWRDKSWFLELDATWIEDIAFDDVNTYYNFLTTSHITMPGSSFAAGLGYGNCIWMHYLTQSFGNQINREIWENASLNNNINFTDEIHFNVFNEVLQSYNTSAEQVLTEYFVSNYFTGNNTVNNYPTYKEAYNYPTPTECEEIHELPYSGSGCKREALSANYLLINSIREEVPFEIEFNFVEGTNKLALIQHLNDGEYDITYLHQSGKSINYISNHNLNEIEKIIIIPVVTSASNGNYEYTYKVNLAPKVTSNEKDNWMIPGEYILEQNYPNPFNPSTTIRFGLSLQSYVKLTIYNILGQKKELLTNKIMTAGYHEIIWNADYFSSGIYIYTIEAKAEENNKCFYSAKKMILIK